MFFREFSLLAGERLPENFVQNRRKNKKVSDFLHGLGFLHKKEEENLWKMTEVYRIDNFSNLCYNKNRKIPTERGKL